jgi:acetolactate synthase-1/2/3 large subunit
MVTSGGAAMNLVHSMAEARASAVPVLAIVGEPPAALQGRGAFQDTSGKNGAVDALEVFRAVSTWCERVEDVSLLPKLLDEACNAAVGSRRGPAVLLIAKDRQVEEVSAPSLPKLEPHACPAASDSIARATAILSSGPVVIVAGDEVSRGGARHELGTLAALLGASIAVAPDARDAFDNDDPRFIGVAGAMGHPDVGRALSKAAVVFLVGTRLPLLARTGLETTLSMKRIVSLGRDPPFVDALHVRGDLRETLQAFIANLENTQIAPPAAGAEPNPPRHASFSSPAILAAVERMLPPGGVILVDAGNTGAQTAHHLRAPHRARWLMAMGMAGMGWTFGAAIGAACATNERCTVFAGDGAFFMHGLEVHTAVEHSLPITYVVFDNGAHGMCLVRERLLLGENAGYNAFGRSHLGAGLAAMFPRLAAEGCRDSNELERALGRAVERRGPTFISAELSDVEIPPFGPLLSAAGPGLTHVERGVPSD